jgi:hypothetical protein
MTQKRFPFKLVEMDGSAGFTATSCVVHTKYVRFEVSMAVKCNDVLSLASLTPVVRIHHFGETRLQS